VVGHEELSLTSSCPKELCPRLASLDIRTTELAVQKLLALLAKRHLSSLFVPPLL